MVDNLTVTLRLRNESREHAFQPDEVALLQNFPEVTVLTFRNVLSTKKFIKKKRSAQIAIALVREKLLEDKTDKEAYDIEMFFASKILPSEEQSSKIVKYSSYIFTNATRAKPEPSEKMTAAVDAEAEKDNSDKKMEDPDDYALWFTKEKIVMNGETFQWSDDGVIF